MLCEDGLSYSLMFSLFPLFVPIDRKNVFEVLRDKRSEGTREGRWLGGGGDGDGVAMGWGSYETMNFNPPPPPHLKVYHLATIPQGSGCLSVGLAKQRSLDW